VIILSSYSVDDCARGVVSFHRNARVVLFIHVIIIDIVIGWRFRLGYIWSIYIYLYLRTKRVQWHERSFFFFVYNLVSKEITSSSVYFHPVQDYRPVGMPCIIICAYLVYCNNFQILFCFQNCFALTDIITRQYILCICLSNNIPLNMLHCVVDKQ
jgi:hypothetical protein